MVYEYFLPFHKLSFRFVYGFLCWTKGYKFMSHLFIFAFSIALGD